MKNKKYIFPFSSNNEHLKDKWWHRLFSVLYFVSIVIFIFGAILVSSQTISDSTFNSKIKNNLKDFSASSDVSLSNTIPNFLQQDTKFGCLQDSGKIDYVSTYSLQNSSFCSADIGSHLSDVSDMIIRNQNPNSKDNLVGALTEIMRRDTEKRYCFIDHDISCASNKIVAYNHSVVFYLLVGIYSLIATYLFSLFL